jgi:predicted regulator of Ras-like GTPase activity (Roadblock/LC7/MglB family)
MSEERIKEILENLKAIKGVYGAAIIEKFGLIKGSALPGWVDPESVAAMVTLILKASQRATKELSEIGGNILTLITTTDAKLGIINLKLAAAADVLQSLI